MRPGKRRPRLASSFPSRHAPHQQGQLQSGALALARMLPGESKAEALARLDDLARARWGDVDTLRGIADVLQDAEEHAKAAGVLERCHELAPQDVTTLLRLAGNLYRSRQHDRACLFGVRLLNLERSHRVYRLLADLLTAAGRQSDAEACLDEALRLEPGDCQAWENKIFQYDLRLDATLEGGAALRRAMAEVMMQALPTPAPFGNRGAEPERRLRIGYVSGDLRRHSAGYIAAVAICWHDPAHWSRLRSWLHAPRLPSHDAGGPGPAVALPGQCADPVRGGAAGRPGSAATH